MSQSKKPRLPKNTKRPKEPVICLCTGCGLEYNLGLQGTADHCAECWSELQDEDSIYIDTEVPGQMPDDEWW